MGETKIQTNIWRLKPAKLFLGIKNVNHDKKSDHFHDLFFFLMILKPRKK